MSEERGRSNALQLWAMTCRRGSNAKFMMLFMGVLFRTTYGDLCLADRNYDSCQEHCLLVFVTPRDQNIDVDGGQSVHLG